MEERNSGSEHTRKSLPRSTQATPNARVSTASPLLTRYYTLRSRVWNAMQASVASRRWPHAPGCQPLPPNGNRSTNSRRQARNPKSVQAALVGETRGTLGRTHYIGRRVSVLLFEDAPRELCSMLPRWALCDHRAQSIGEVFVVYS
jgi:hypothetical protein